MFLAGTDVDLTRVTLALDQAAAAARRSAVEARFGASVDDAILIKHSGQTPEGQRRYSPPVITGTSTHCCSGNPDADHTNSSFAERQNPTMRMSMRRFTRLTNASSKKVENHAHAVALHSCGIISAGSIRV